jgi:hypothetical protein
MPTGYTAPVADGTVTDLRTFALQCARGMGALIMMRDDPWDAPIPEAFEPSDHSQKKLAELRAERERLYGLSDDEADAAAKAEFDEKTAAKARWLSEQREQRLRYEAMIEQVTPWQRAPEGLKEFMLDQLYRGLEFDCPRNDTYWDEPKLLSGIEWRSAKLAKVQRDIEYHSVEDAKERERALSRTAWITQLRAALPPAADAKAQADA